MLPVCLGNRNAIDEFSKTSLKSGDQGLTALVLEAGSLSDDTTTELYDYSFM